jgi:hypothetical protein
LEYNAHQPATECRPSSATISSWVKIRCIQNYSLTESCLLSVVDIHRDEGMMSGKAWLSKRVISLKRSTGIEGKQHVEFSQLLLRIINQ